MTSTAADGGRTDAPAPAVPVLTTARLRLRAPRLADFDDSFAMWSDPAVVRFIGGRPASREDAWGRLLRYLGHWAALGHGFWIVETREDGRFVGEVGFADFHRELPAEVAFEPPEHGWALAPWAHGRGYAREAVAASLAWADDHLSASRTVCMIDPANQPSLRVAAGAGYRELVRPTYKGDPIVLLERRRPAR